MCVSGWVGGSEYGEEGTGRRFQTEMPEVVPAVWNLQSPQVSGEQRLSYAEAGESDIPPTPPHLFFPSHSPYSSYISRSDTHSSFPLVSLAR